MECTEVGVNYVFNVNDIMLYVMQLGETIKC